MYYEINVALDGKHFFATHERSVTNRNKLENIVKVFVEKFPESEGYEISVSKWQNNCKNIDIENILEQV